MNAAPTQELRLAVTMTGGVSLAIWMGGVARELNLLYIASRHGDTASEPRNPDQHVMQLYRRLLDLTKVSVDIDVLSGTSAGGINAAVLGYAKANDKDIESWGAQWNSLASLEDLLRNPKDKNPPSLLLGDSYLYPKLLTAIQGFPTVASPGSAGRTDDNQPATTVFITTTLLNGEVSRFTDSYGTMIQDTDHQGLFTFDHGSLTGKSDDLIPRLALAGRCTSSFPAAFEPAFVPYLAATPKAGAVPVRPDMDRFIDITRPHWVADGGLLANRPIRPILQTIFDRPADLPVRRVLLYVVPSSGPTEDPLLGAVADDPSSPLSMTSALVKDLSAVLSQSIAADLRALQDHNDTVDALTDSRLQLAQIGAKLGCRLTDVGSFLADYADREGRALAQPVVREVTRLIDGAAAGETGIVPASWKGELENGSDTEQKCLEAAIEAITEHWVVDEPPTQEQIPAYGRPAWDGAKATALAMLRLAQQLADPSQADVLRRLRNNVHDAFIGVKPRPDVARIVRGLLKPAPGADPTPPAARATPAAFCGYAATEFAEAMAAGMDANTGTVNATADYAALRDAWKALAESLSLQEGLFRDLAAKGGTAAQQLGAYVDYLFAPDGPGLSARLFDLHAAQRAITPLTDAVEQKVELIQVSADTRTSLDDQRSTAASKLTGMQLQHFGAFYKQSWRANDWMWGRVDAAGWLVHMLLQPQRLRYLFGSLPGGRAAFIEALGSVVADQPGFALSLNDRAIQELAFLESPDTVMPPSLPNTSMAVAEAVQRWIVDKELPAVADAIQVDIDNHSANWRGEKEWVKTVLSTSTPQVVDGSGNTFVKTDTPAVTAARLSRTAELFRANPVPGQTFSSEVGQPLLARTVGKALATGTNALTAAGSEISALKPLFASLRGVTLTTYVATKATKSTPRALLEAGVAMIVVGFVLALGWGNVLGVGGIGLIVAGLAVLALGVWGISWRGLLVFLGFLLIIGLIAPALPVVRRWLFSTDSTDLGVVTPWLTSLPQWLGSVWWHPLAVIGVLLVVVAGISFGFGHSRQLRRRNQALRARIGKGSQAGKG